MKKKLFPLLALLLSCGCMLYANWQTDARALKCHTPEGTGNFSLNAISAEVLGKIYTTNPEFPDLILKLDRWYPGARYYKYVRHDKQGVPVFELAGEVELPFQSMNEGGSTSCVVQNGKEVKLFWYTTDTLNVASYNAERREFIHETSVPFPKMRFKPKAMFVEPLGKRGYLLWYGAQDRWAVPVPGNWRKGDFFPYDGAGIWRGKFSYMGLYCIELNDLYKAVTEPEMISERPNEVLQSYCRLSDVAYGKQGKGIVTGSYLGGLYFYKQKGGGLRAETKKYLVDASGNALRHPGVWASPVSYPSADGVSSDLIATCEGGIYFYRYTGKFTENGNPVYDSPVPLQESKPMLFGGSLPVPTVVDWDGDGVLDIVSGNSQGHILFFKNTGTDAAPKFTTPVSLQAGGRTIHVQPGYREDIQGPLEARWGYTSPTVFDWNGDGKQDILFSDSRGKHMLLKGTEGDPLNRLEPERPLYLYDLDMHGTWRCRPGVAEMDGRIAYITLDDENQLHLYARIDDYNLEDLGKLTLKDGSNISASAAASGGTGRLKIDIVDWDGDGKKDLILGTCKHHYIPDNKNGLPGCLHSSQRRTEKTPRDTYRSYTLEDIELQAPPYMGSSPEYNAAATILFMRNVGSDAKPVYEFPSQMYYKGERIKLGQHAVGVDAAMLGTLTNGLPNLLVGDERGRFYLLERSDLNW